jgi:hypothetical protein
MNDRLDNEQVVSNCQGVYAEIGKKSCSLSKKSSCPFVWVVAVGLAVVIVLLFYAAPKYWITNANYGRIKPGMSKYQVVAILGILSSRHVWDYPGQYHWTGCDCEIMVELNSENEVIRTSCTPKEYSSVFELIGQDFVLFE